MQGLGILLVCLTAVEANDSARELSRFSSRAECAQAMAIAEAYISGIEEHQKNCINPRQWERLEIAKRNAKTRWWCWQHLTWAHDLYTAPTQPSHGFADEYVLHNARQALDRLHEWIGTVRWNLGSMPQPTP